MSIKQLLIMGNPKLITPSIAVEDFNNPLLRSIIQDMHDTMIAKGGVGIAAPQIGYFVRLIMFGFQKSERYPDAQEIPFTTLVNPSFSPLSEETEDGWEGCLSVPGLRGLVPRYKSINYTAQDIHGHTVSGQADGFKARVIQHECDHLDGILYPRRIKDLRYFGFESEL